MVCYQVNQSFLKEGTSRVGWPGSLSHCVAVKCSQEMDVFDMDVSKASWQALILLLKKKKKTTELSVLTHTAPTLESVISSFGSFFGKKDIKKPRPGWRGPKDTNFHCKISYTVGLTIVTRLHITSSWKWKSLCRVWLFATPWTIQFMEFLPAMRETRVWSLGWEDPLEKGKATHSSILA